MYHESCHLMWLRAWKCNHYHVHFFFWKWTKPKQKTWPERERGRKSKRRKTKGTSKRSVKCIFSRIFFFQSFSKICLCLIYSKTFHLKKNCRVFFIVTKAFCIFCYFFILQHFNWSDAFGVMIFMEILLNAKFLSHPIFSTNILQIKICHFDDLCTMRFAGKKSIHYFQFLKKIIATNWTMNDIPVKLYFFLCVFFLPSRESLLSRFIYAVWRVCVYNL